MTDLTGQTVMITGASRGIGAATARHFAGLGARVALLARDGAALEALAGDIGDQAMALPCDMGDWAAVTAAVVATEARFGPIHVLINNAGLIDPIARLADSNPEDWGRVVDVNLKGVYHGLRAVLPGMLAAGGGTVLNLSSGAASSTLEGWSHYCATKAAVLALTRCADREYRDQGIRVIGLSPGTVATGMQVQIRASGINPVSRLDPSAHIPADWVARALAYLCGPGGDAHRGTDFSLKTAEGRAEAGLS
ncbi:SDR family oxidoreductase [Ruegeria pomeroyi]|nr:SDR family oxidoreductase [Ruegeria pomeroyi]